MPDEPKYPIFNPFKKYYTLQIPEAVARYRGLSPGSKLVYGRLYRYAGANGHAFPKIETLAEEIGLGVRQTWAYLSELQEKDFIFLRRRYHQRSLYEFQSHPSLAAGEIGEPRWEPPKVELQDPAIRLSEVKLQDPAVDKLQDPAKRLPSAPLMYEEGHCEEGQLLPPTPSETNLQTQTLDLEDDIVTFVQNAYRRLNRRAKLVNLRARQNERLCEDLRRAESNHGPVDLRRSIEAYLSEQSAWLQENHWPLPTFLKQIDRYIETTTPQQGNGAYKAGAIKPGDGPTPDSPAPAGPMASSPLPFSAQEWNRVVTAGPPVEAWTRRDSGLAAAAGDSDFIAALPKVLAACQAVLEAQPEDVDWLNFRWLLKQGKTGAENWYRIATGDKPWLTKHSNGKPQVSRMYSKLAERKAQIAREKELAGTAPGNG